MSQSLDILSMKQSQSDEFICAYRNQTNLIQVIRIVNIQDWYFEKIVFPCELVLFEARPEAQLEVHVEEDDRVALLERHTCSQLKIVTNHLI